VTVATAGLPQVGTSQSLVFIRVYQL